MRALAFLVIFLVCSAATITYPFAGILAWEWITLAAPHNLIWGTISTIQFNLILAVLTLGTWFLSSEPKMIPNHKLNWLFVLFTFWLVIAELFSHNHDYSWDYTDRFMRVMIFIFLLSIMMRDKVRIHAVVWVLVISIGFYAAKGGFFTILSGGGYRVWGPKDTMINDNNSFGLASVFLIPFVVYLYKYTDKKYIRLALATLVILCVASALGTQSRGAFITIGVLAAYAWWRSPNKIITLVIVLFLSVPLLLFMPETWYDRMGTIGEATSDASFMSRVAFWKVSFNAALDNPVTGVGLRSLYHTDISSLYGAEYDKYRALHSIYFEIMAGMGLVGFSIYMSLFFMSWRMANKVRRYSVQAGKPWMGDLALACTLSLVAFMVGGAALSNEMWEGYLIAMTVIGALHHQLFPDGVPKKTTYALSRISPLVTTNKS